MALYQITPIMPPHTSAKSRCNTGFFQLSTTDNTNNNKKNKNKNNDNDSIVENAWQYFSLFIASELNNTLCSYSGATLFTPKFWTLFRTFILALINLTIAHQN